MFEKAKEWMTPERALAMQGIGLGLSQLDKGMAPNLSPVYEALDQRKQAAQMRKVMDVPGVLDSFSPQQRAVLASMPEALATQIIMDKAFQAPAMPDYMTVGNTVLQKGPDGVTPVWSATETPESPKPYSDIGRIQADMAAGLITPQQAEAAMGSSASYGTTLQFWTDDAGKTRAGVVGSDGSLKEVAPPEGGSWATGIEKVDAGTQWIIYDKRTGERIGTEPKDIRGAAAEAEIGRAEGAATGSAITGVDAAAADAENAIALMDSIVSDPALGSITGMVQGRLPPMTQSGTDLNVKIEQLQGKAFLEAFENLKGGGAISEREGQAATAAMARLNRAQSPEAYAAAVNELRAIMQLGLDRIRARAGTTAPKAGNVTTGGVEWSIEE